MSVRAELEALRSLFEQRLSHDLTTEEAFQRLYEDLEMFREQATFQISRPVFMELILLLDRLESALESDELASDPMAFLDTVRVEVAEILARRAISPVAISGGVFDPKMQRAVDVVEAEELEQHNAIARVVRQGYEQDGHVVRSADVVVRRYRPSEVRRGE